MRLGRVEVHLSGPYRDQVSNELKARSETVHEQLGAELDWEKYMAIEHEGSRGQDLTDELHTWMVDKLLAYKRVFGPILKEVIATEG